MPAEVFDSSGSQTKIITSVGSPAPSPETVSDGKVVVAGGKINDSVVLDEVAVAILFRRTFWLYERR